jgi:hypothetical protein
MRLLCCCLLGFLWLIACDGHPGRDTRAGKSSLANLTVELISVKFVDGQYRYFCSIHNEGSTPFSGSVRIRSVNKRGEAVGGDRFTTTTPIEPGLRQVVYFDGRTGPPDVHGEYGIVSVRFDVE